MLMGQMTEERKALCMMSTCPITKTDNFCIYRNKFQRLQHLNYDDRLNYSGLMRLEKRRVISDLNIEKETFLN